MSTGTPIRPEMTVGAIAEQYPASAPVLAELRRLLAAN